MHLRVSYSSLMRDGVAGLVVFLVALPLCLGIANASGVGPIAGLISGIVGGVVVAALSGSPLSVSGPAAGLVVIVIDGIAKLGGFPAFALAVLLAGAIQFALGLLRAGQLASYVPSAVIKGMLAAIGLLLIVKQVPFALGLSSDVGMPGSAVPLQVTPVAVAIAAVSVLLLFGWDTRLFKRFAIVRAVPAPLVVVSVGIGATLLLQTLSPHLMLADEFRVALPELNSLSALGAALTTVDWHLGFGQLFHLDLWRVALTLAIVASLETLLSLEAVEQIDPERRPVLPNRELKAQGVGNVLAGLLGGLPITSVIVRSSVNVNAGAKSRLSAIIHGVLLCLSVFALTGVLNLIPLASLAAILIHTGIKLAKPTLFVQVAKLGPSVFIPFAVTIVGVFAIDLLVGVIAGIVCSFFWAACTSLRRPVTLAQRDNHYVLSFCKATSFLGKVKVKRYLQDIPHDAVVTIDATQADYLDHDVRELLDTFMAQAVQRGMTVEFLQHSPQASRARAHSSALA